MNLPYEWLIGTRYLRSTHRSGFVSFVASMSVIGLALGVAVLIVVLSVLNGFERELRSRMLAVTSHATITGVDGEIANWREAQADAAREPDVMAVVPFVESRGLLANGERVAGVMVRGILPEEEVKAVGFGARMRGGTFESLQPGKFRIILGSALATELGVMWATRWCSWRPRAARHPPDSQPRMKRFTVSGDLRVRHVRVRPRPRAHAHEGCRDAVSPRRQRHGTATRARGSVSRAADGAHRGARHRLRRQGLLRQRLDARSRRISSARSSSRSR